jgi:hypothetical protein
MPQYIRINHKEGLVFHTAQRQRLGQLAYDDHGARWSYCWINEDVSAGEYVEDMANADLLSGATGTVTTASAAGTNTLIDSGEFTGDDFVGALGSTLGDTIANGGGQGFHVTEMIDANTLGVSVHHGDADPTLTGNGWETATTTSTTYSLWFPGRCKQGDDQPAIVRGFVQVDVDVSENEFGWVKQTSAGWVKIDTSDTGVPVAGEWLVPQAAGLVSGLTHAATTADEVSQQIAQCITGDLAGVVDGLVFANLHVRNDAVSMRFPRISHPYNEVTI